MDTAPKNNSIVQDSKSPIGLSSPPTSDSSNTNPNDASPTPIEPGQFVTTQEENAASSTITTPPLPSVPPPPTPPSNEPAPPAQNFPPKFPVMGEQPNPTPYAAPPDQSPAPEEHSQIKKLRLIVIIIGVLILVAAIAAAGWFLVLGKKTPKETVKSETSQPQIEEPPPLPKRTRGGFADLPQILRESTREATSEPRE